MAFRCRGAREHREALHRQLRPLGRPAHHERDLPVADDGQAIGVAARDRRIDCGVERRQIELGFGAVTV